MKESFSQMVTYDYNEKDEYITIKVSRKNLPKVQFPKKMFSAILEQLTFVKFKENFHFLLDKTKETTLSLKDNILDKYNNFLSEVGKKPEEKSIKQETHKNTISENEHNNEHQNTLQSENKDRHSDSENKEEYSRESSKNRKEESNSD